jgi:cytochrome c-type biogenesis protein CcmH
MQVLERIFKTVFLAVWLAIAALPVTAYAVNPDEVLSDPVLEQRARELSSEIRCMKCQNQSIDDSDADLARDLRLLVRDRLVAGDSDQQVLDYLVDRYGEFVLLRPSFSIANLVLWLGPALLLAIGGFLAVRTVRNRPDETSEVSSNEALSKAEQTAITKILDERD